MKDIEIRGQRTATRRRPASLNIPQRAEWCLRHMLEIVDEKYGYVPFVGASLGEQRPHFVHHRLDWTEVLPYDIYGLVIARQLTGSDRGIEIQQAQRKLYLGFFNELDGLIHAPRSPWSNPYPLDLWEQARALYALIYWYQDSGEERLLACVRGLIDGLFSLSHQEGRRRVLPVELLRSAGGSLYSVGALIDPLVKAYELTGSGRALQLAEGLTHFMLEPANGYFDADGGFWSGYRFVVAAINGLSRFAALSAEPELVQRVKRIHDRALAWATRFGSDPGLEPACSNMELNYSALSLIRLGFTEYWDQIDRFTRNHTVEAQFLDEAEWVKEKAAKGRILDREKWVYEFWPQDLEVLPYDDYRDVVKRSIGGFVWTVSADEHLFLPATVMLCCSAHALRTFQLVWEQCLTEELSGVALNLHFNCENRLGEVISCEPFAGKTSVTLKKDARLRIRVPEYAMGAELKATRGGKACALEVSGRYADLGPAQAGVEYCLEYPLNPRQTEEKQFCCRNKDCAFLERTIPYQARWRGNTVVELSPQSREEKRMYKRRHLDTDRIQEADFSCFISAKDVRW
jgi:hypothetical protein